MSVGETIVCVGHKHTDTPHKIFCAVVFSEPGKTQNYLVIVLVDPLLCLDLN